MLATDGGDTGVEIGDGVAALLNLRKPLGFADAALQRGDGVLGIAARQLLHVGFGVELGLGGLFHAGADAVEALLQRRAGLLLAHQPVPQPHRERQHDERHEHDDGPGDFLQQRHSAEGGKDRRHLRPLRQTDEEHGQHEQHDRNADKLTHGNAHLLKRITPETLHPAKATLAAEAAAVWYDRNGVRTRPRA